MISHKIIWPTLLLLIANCGCSPLGPDFTTPDAPIADQWYSDQSNYATLSQREELSSWWQKFNDPVLSTLITMAANQNLSLQVAGLRILEARANLARVRGNLYPQLQEANGELLRTGIPEPAQERYFTSLGAGLDVAWELDFWGKFRRAIESADSSLFSSLADYDDILVSLTAEVAQTYIDIRTLQERIALAQKNAKLQQESLQLIQIQLEAGVVTELDLLQAETLQSTTLATIPNLKSSLRTAQNGLAVLLGMLPGEIEGLIAEREGIPEVSEKIAIGAPAELLRRRPDVKRSEMQAAAQSARVGIAITELYPSFSLLGSLGYSTSDSGSDNLGDLFDSDNFSYTFGPTFSWKLFQYGRLKNDIRIQDARLQQAIVSYQDTVLNAAREVENAMSSLVLAKREAEYLQQGVLTSQRSTELSTLQYTEGLTDYQRVLDSIRSLTQRQDQHAQAKGRIGSFTIALYKAMGGGWTADNRPAAISQLNINAMEVRTDWGQFLDNIPAAKATQ
ncbi:MULTISPECIES: efflux transporter outer membrane subunit [Desulfosediminicola]|uniref:efflux transporter outer membrane subunit n=1 Tax=Desulfosediminicola TaxID=2886823 RepID=UPI0010AC9FC6|nr:efflux transporter outer membrane subunit [Desulfosediminicola ganghwensis]